MTGRELRDALLSARGSAQREPVRSQLAGAVLRAAIEAEVGIEEPRWIIRRSGRHLLVAIDDNDGEMLADMAEQLAAAPMRWSHKSRCPRPPALRKSCKRKSTAWSFRSCQHRACCRLRPQRQNRPRSRRG